MLRLLTKYGVLSAADIERQSLPAGQFALVPEMPLTCEYYGLILPNNAPQWRNTQNQSSFCARRRRCKLS
ncbi:hypothetical protein IQ273_02975 [Nodosilinea sp. LEGE 07298]|uniref:hypothetical protein n=1 Tax=Nodosilinea sp. LEGE 07298 TaxID=2777970 RepID=UPI00187E07B9|nr:hypothetical protein [Nodosilinea sp. LEGE 07298]MBE9108383.1 hypothetical protein [Nodosilinea sp. LEGE 07298]